MNVEQLVTYFREHLADMLDVIHLLVEQETPSTDKSRLDLFAALLAERMAGAGAAVTLVPTALHGNHLRVCLQPHHPAGSTSQPGLVLCHYDTVWPVGAVATHPFRIEDGKATGPGIFDMQTSLVLVEFALRAVRDLDLVLPRPVTILITSDEEIGSGESRGLIEETAQKAAYVLVMESPLPGGVLKTARKGTGTFTIETVGKAAHAGVDPDKGINAIEEMAHQVLAAHDLADRTAGTTISVGRVEGGTATNVIPARCTAQVDVRAWTQAEADRITQAMGALQPVAPGAQVNITGGWNRPPLELSATHALFERVREIGKALGLDLHDGSTGGGSDGNFTGALGVPTLDGLGVPGDGAHADHEHILIDEIPARAALLVAMWMEL